MNKVQIRIVDQVTFAAEGSNNFIDGCIVIRGRDKWSIAISVPVNGEIKTIRRQGGAVVQSFEFTGHDFNVACHKLREESIGICTPIDEIIRLQSKIERICELGSDAHNEEYYTVFTLYRVVGNTNCLTLPPSKCR